VACSERQGQKVILYPVWKYFENCYDAQVGTLLLLGLWFQASAEELNLYIFQELW